MPRELDTEIRFHEWQEELRRHGFAGDEPTLPRLPEFGAVETVEYHVLAVIGIVVLGAFGAALRQEDGDAPGGEPWQ